LTLEELMSNPTSGDSLDPNNPSSKPTQPPGLRWHGC
jgi:hypothetical protein